MKKLYIRFFHNKDSKIQIPNDSHYICEYEGGVEDEARLHINIEGWISNIANFMANNPNGKVDFVVLD